jgi:hypothetical protein
VDWTPGIKSRLSLVPRRQVSHAGDLEWLLITNARLDVTLAI